MSVVPSDPLLAGLLVARLGVVALGAAVAYRGVRGYRRTGNRAMLAFGVAFGLIAVDPVVTALAGLLLNPGAVGVVVVTGDIVLYGAAFSLMLYALYRLA